MRLLSFFIFSVFTNLLSVYSYDLNKSDEAKSFTEILNYIFQTNSTINAFEKNIILDENGHITTISASFNDTLVKNPPNFQEFPVLPELQYLAFSGRKIYNGELPNTFLNKFPKLKKLTIMNSEIHTIPQDIKMTDSLEEINLNNNAINSFPYQLNNAKNLRILKIKNNKITGPLTNQINDFKNLETIDIGNNLMEGEIVIGQSIKNLNATNNKFTNLSCDGPSKLEIIDVKDNSIDNFSPNFFNNTEKLKSIYLNSNNLKELPYDFFYLPNIEDIDISNNPQLKTEFLKFSNGYKPSCKTIINFSCIEKNACFDEATKSNYKECTQEEVQTIRNKIKESKQKENKGSNTLTILIIIALIIIGIVSIIWMYVSYKRKNKSREADVIISPTINTSNYYDDMFKNAKNSKKQLTVNSFDNSNNNNNNNNNDNNNNNNNNININNSQTTLTTSTTNMLPLHSSSINQSFSQNSIHVTRENSSSINNLIMQNPVLDGNTSTSVSPVLQSSIMQNSIMQSPTIVGNVSCIMSPIMKSSTVINNSSGITVTSPIVSPILPSATTMNFTSPILQSTSIQPLQIPASAHINNLINDNNNSPINNNNNAINVNNNNNNSINNVNIGVNNMVRQNSDNINTVNNNNNNYMIRQNSVGYINGHCALPLSARSYTVHTLTHPLLERNISTSTTNTGSSSSSSSRNVDNSAPPSYYGMSINDIEDIKLKKKMLQERELSEKYNLNNNLDRSNSRNDNLPPYSE